MRFITISLDDDGLHPEFPDCSLIHEGVSLYEVRGVLETALIYVQETLDNVWAEDGEEPETH